MPVPFYSILLSSLNSWQRGSRSLFRNVESSCLPRIRHHHDVEEVVVHRGRAGGGDRKGGLPWGQGPGEPELEIGL